MTTMHGWGRYPVVDAQLAAPPDRARLRQLVAQMPGPSVARGMGRSYGDSSLGGHMVLTQQLDLLAGFDAQAGLLQCGAGTTLDSLLEFAVARNWFLPVVPGTRFVTVGGAIASDVHGKNHLLAGCFSQHVEELELVVGSGDCLVCSRTSNEDLFRATCGGMGLTGIIVRATLRLARVQGAGMRQATFAADGLAHALALLREHSSARHAAAWIDCLAGGGSAGRSLVTVAEHVGDPVARRIGNSRAVPFDMPAPVLNRWTGRLFNAAYHRMGSLGSRWQTTRYESFLFPLDGLLQWNRLYGKGGFFQYQFVVPAQSGEAGLREILGRIRLAPSPPMLAVLKVLGAENANMLSFPMEGYTLAVDFPMDERLFGWFSELDAIVLDHGGRIYLCKDARMAAPAFRRGYPRWEAFQEVRGRYGALGRFASGQSMRLGLD